MMNLRTYLMLFVAAGLYSVGSDAQGTTNSKPWHGPNGLLVRADGSPWRPELIINLDLPRFLMGAEPFRALLPTVAPEDPPAVDIEFEPINLRSPDFRLLVRGPLGVLEQVEPPPPRTYRGRVLGQDNATVVASLDAQGRLDASIETQTHGWYIQPLSDFVPDADPRAHAIYSHRNVVSTPERCSLELPTAAGEPEPESPEKDPSAGVEHRQDQAAGSPPGVQRPLANTVGVPLKSTSYRAAGIAFHLDSPYYQQAGGTNAAAMNDAEFLLAQVQHDYGTEPGMTWFQFNLKGMVMESVGGFLFPSTDASTLLSEFQSYWGIANNFGFETDFAHLLTGKDINGLGIAYVNQACASAGAFGVSEAHHSSNLEFRSWVVSHELAHNLGAVHDSCGIFEDPCKMMCPSVDTITCVAFDITWSAKAITAVNAGIAKSCFDSPSGTIYAAAGTTWHYPDGSLELPFPSITLALPHVSAGWSLDLLATTHDEGPLVLNQPMTITSTGGTAKIE